MTMTPFDHFKGFLSESVHNSSVMQISMREIKKFISFGPFHSGYW